MCPYFFRHGIADGVGNVDGGCAFIDHSLHHLAEKIEIRAGCVFRGKFDVIAMHPRETNRFRGGGNALLARHF